MPDEQRQLPPGTRLVSEYIAEVRAGATPERLALLDKARAEIRRKREAGELTITVGEIEMTREGMREVGTRKEIVLPPRGG